MTNVRDVEKLFRKEDQGLREDVRKLGNLVGRILIEQSGPSLFEEVEAWRLLARQRRRGEGSAEQTLSRLASQCSNAGAHEIVRAFSFYFFAINFAERLHRIRRGLDYLREGTAQPGSLQDVVIRLRRRGVTDEQLERTIRTLVLEPVFTAHPTEATRRSVLQKEQRLARIWVERIEKKTFGPLQQATWDARVLGELTTLWQTEEYTDVRPTVAEEVEHVSFYLSDVIWRVVPHLHRTLDHVLGRRSDKDPSLEPLVRFGTWAAGDMDGNPNVGPDTIRATLKGQRQICLRKYGQEIEGLIEYLTQSERLVTVSKAFQAALTGARAKAPEVFARIPERSARMPYRAYLWWVKHRLIATAEAQEHAYASPEELRLDLELIRDSLDACRGHRAGSFLVQSLIHHVQVFGFHLASLDVRLHAASNRGALGDVLGDEAFAKKDAAQRVAIVEQAFLKGVAVPKGLATESERVLEVFRAVREGALRYGERAARTLIVSMARGVDDAITPLLLARAAGCFDEGEPIPLDVAPLFETVGDLEQAPDTVHALFRNTAYRTHLAARGDVQIVMLGYSDSGKDSGIGASRLALYEAQEKLTSIAREYQVKLLLFHGRGGSISRGGGKPRQAILAEPREALTNHLRVTEQGEILHAKYGLRGLATRTFELMAGALLERLHSEERDVPERARKLAQELARFSRSVYRQLVYEDPRFVPYFRSATPIDVIERMSLGSRPSRRTGKSGIEDLRAIPWVFAWTQARHLLPGWFGIGTGLEQLVNTHGLSALQDAVAAWPFLDRLLSDVEMALAKADMDIASRYANLASEESTALFPLIAAEHERAASLLCRLREQTKLLQNDRVLRRALMLRNPYVDPMSFLQIELLGRWRRGNRSDEGLLSALIATVHGIARGMQNTG